MSLTTLSYNEAQRIVDTYTDVLLTSESLSPYNKFRYSELKGYDVFDIDNALKLISAYRVYTTREISLERLREAASIDGTAIMSYFTLFRPDNIAQQLNKLKGTNALSESMRIDDENIFETDLWKRFSVAEAHDSFLDFCLSISNDKETYWEKVYERLNITWDDRDEYDPIYFIISQRHLSDNQSGPVKINEEHSVDDSKAEASPKIESIGSTLITMIVMLMALLIGIYFVSVRRIILGCLAAIGLVKL